MKVERHSPSSLNCFCASPAMYVLERVLGFRQPVGSPAHRGTAVEAGLSLGLLDPAASEQACIDEALKTYDRVSALSGDPRREKMREDIPGMVASALAELRPYGIPSRTQGFVEWRPEGLASPIVGYFDYEWADHGIIVDLKTSEKLPSQVKVTHARQVALYAMSDNYDPRVSYVTPKKRATYRVENIREHRDALLRIAMAVERFLALSDDPQFFVGITAPDTEHYYFGAQAARQAAFDHWHI